MPGKSYFRVYRSIFNNWVAQSKPYDTFHAWVWIISHANFKDTVREFRGQVINVRRGQLVTSYDALAAEFGWSRNKVMRYTSRLENEGMIAKKCNTYGTVITVENYELYQGGRTTKSKTEGTSEGTADGTHYKECIKNDKERGKGRDAFGVYGHVTLSREEFDLLKSQYGDRLQRYIEELDEYVESTGKKYMSYAAAIMRWARNDKRFNGEHDGVEPSEAQKRWNEKKAKGTKKNDA